LAASLNCAALTDSGAGLPLGERGGDQREQQGEHHETHSGRHNPRRGFERD